MDFHDNKRAIVAMLVSNGAFICNDALVKLISGALPMGQIIFVRGLVSIALMAVLCQATGVFRQLGKLADRWVLLRVLAEVCSTLLYLIALLNIPIANAAAILQALPLVVTAAAAVFLGAPVGWRRWTAIGIGFVGVLLIVQPGSEGFSTWSLFALASVVTMTARDLITRKMAPDIPTNGVSLTTSIGVTVLGAGLLLGGEGGWQPMTLMQVAVLSVAAVFILCGYIFIILAMRSGDISTVAPFRYSAVLWALGLGYLIWGEVPDVLTVIGTAVVIATGVYTFLREQRMSRQARPAQSAGGHSS